MTFFGLFKIRWNYFTIGATLGLATLMYLNRDMLILEKDKATHVPVVIQVTATPAPSGKRNFDEEFMQVCVEDSKNPAYCECSKEMVKEVDPLWNDGTASAVYQETKTYTSELCMIDA